MPHVTDNEIDSPVFTPRVSVVLRHARDQAARNASNLETDHILMGIAVEAEGVAAAALRQLKVNLPELRDQLRNMPMNRVALADREESVEVARVIAHATDIARASGHTYLGTEHLLLGLLSVPNSIAFQVLNRLAVTYERAQATIQGLCVLDE